jgi:hypothetical protein
MKQNLVDRKSLRRSIISVITAIICFCMPLSAQIDPGQYRLDNPNKPAVKDTLAAAELMSGMRYRLINGNQPGARLDLEELAAVYPDYNPAERMLLAARWKLAEGDTTAFEDEYWKVVEFSLTRDNFDALFDDVAPIFNPQETQEWESLSAPESKAAFLSRFWRSRDPDPISFSNPRLLNHYKRLLEAQKNYSHPVYGPARHSRNHGGVDSQPFDPTASLVDFPYEQPKPEFKRPSHYELDSRGLLYLRHGPPTRTVRGNQAGVGQDSETWFYGNATFTFASLSSNQGYIPVPGGSANLDDALSSESTVADSGDNYQSYFAAEFNGPGNSVVLEFYQSLPAESSEKPEKPEGVVAIFDTTWQQVAISRSPARRLEVDKQQTWVAVNTLTVPPGLYYYAIRMDVDPRHPVIRKSMRVERFTTDSLNLSGIIFGSPLDEDKTLANRSNADLLPRPTLRFTAGEAVSVYYEIYGLKPGSDGYRKYREWITVSMAGAEERANEETFSGSAERLKRWTEDRSNSRTLSFEREADREQKIVGEHFVVDTSDMEQGSYQLQLEVEDTVSGERRDVTWYFDLAAAPVEKYKDQF